MLSSLSHTPHSEKSLLPRQGERVRRHCATPMDILYLEASGVENECLLITGTYLWQEYENTEFLQSRQSVIIITMAYFWSDDDMSLELGYNRNVLNLGHFVITHGGHHLMLGS